MTDVDPGTPEGGAPPFPGAPSDPAKQGGLKEDKTIPAGAADDDEPADIESDEADPRAGEGGGMIGEG